MTVYLTDIPLEQAKDRFQTALVEAGLGEILGQEEIPLDQNSLGRVLAESVWAKISSPHYHASAMDGYAVRAQDTAGATPATPLDLTIQDLAVYLDTGDPLPLDRDAVIPIENVEPLDEEGKPAADPRRPAGIRIRAAVTPWKHVRPMGEDVVATQLLLPAGHVLRPVDLGAIAACGHDRITVSRKPRVAVIPTGSELVPIGTEVQPGDILEFNSLVMAAQVEAWGGEAVRLPITPDRLQDILEVVESAARDFDLVLLNAGSSAGSEDFSAEVVTSLGDLLVHGVAVRPGHPVILGMLEAPNSRTVPIIGVPGYPVSATLTGEIFVEPLIARWLGRRASQPLTMPAEMTRKVVSPAGDDDYLRVAVGQVGERTLVAPLTRGAGVITSLVRADGIVVVPRGTQGLPAGEPVEVRLYRQPDEISRTIFAMGSHDLTLDVLAQYLAGEDRRLASANVGSLGGLVALRRGEAHFAGSHLLDPETGEYNLSYIREYLPGSPVVVVTLVGRQQGLIIRQMDVGRIRNLEDLTRPGVRFVNRQRGAGTRVLLDYQLDLLGIAPDSLQGYNQEEFTHLAVAAAVASGRADCGMGIAAAAQALDLGFVPLFQERYDLVIPAAHFESELIAPLFSVLKNPAFQAAVGQMPGYDTDKMGEIVAEIN